MTNNSMMLAGKKRIVPGPKGANLRTSRSLIISPNLDALLEYEEKKIRGLNSPTTPTSLQLPLSAPIGLPPPPRRTSRKPTAPTSLIVKTPLVQESSQQLECENPYINPAPVFEFEDVLGVYGIEAWSANEGPCSVREVQKTSGASQNSKEQVEKVVSMSRSLPNDDDAKAECKAPQLGVVLDTSPTQRSNLRGRARAKGKQLELKETVPLPGSNDNLVMDIRRHPISFDSFVTSRRRRPFISHRYPSSQRSSSSSSGHSSTSTYEPASTIDTRISISSTMYPTSPSVLVDEPLPISLPNSSIYSDHHGHHSFIDIITPAVAEFTLPPSPPRTSDAELPQPIIPNKPDVGRQPAAKSTSSLSPTPNFLDLDERSDRIRQNRKLARVFGKPPGPNMLSLQNRQNPGLSLIAGHRAPLTEDTITHDGVWLPVDARNHHSVPLSVHDDFLFDHHDAKKNSHPFDGIASSMSFIDLSDDLGSARAAPTRGRPRRPSPSLIESVFPEEQVEEARRRKREKLAKLHRFLGSRVPTNLVLGPDTADPGLPPLDPTIMSVVPESRKDWLRRRRSSSAAAYSSTWSDEIDRIKEDLNSTEKAINVRRAQKMEKVFGVAPPQILYHTRRSPSPSVSNPAIIGQNKSISGWTSPGESQLPVIGLRNVNRSSYSKKKTKDDRPGTSESDRALLLRYRDSSNGPDLRKRTSAVYMHYQDSLNSLNDIIDRDDKESLAELHEYLNSGDMSVPPPLQASTRSPQSSDRRLSNASIKSERRRSLPARTSICSSEYSIATPRPDVTDFQTRRRRAAKLTQFFGVNYRELIKDVLESIECGLEHERKHGTLDPEEVEDLLARLRKLRTKRSRF